MDRLAAADSRASSGLFRRMAVVGVAPNASTLVRSFDGLPVTSPSIDRIGTLPFLVAAATVL